MKIQYFGTAAYEGVPSLFCQCGSCKRAMSLGGKNMRSRAQALLNDEILLDFNADTVYHYHRFRFDWNKVKYCLITHGHSDHFYPNDLIMFAEKFYAQQVPYIEFYGAKPVYEQICRLFSTEYAEANRGAAKEVAVGDLLQIGQNKVLVLHADHGAPNSVLYAIEDKDGKRILYAHDTGVFTDEVITQMHRLGRFDIVSFDCTGAADPTPWEHGHMNLVTNARMKERLLAEGLADQNTKFVITHFSHNALRGLSHEELCKEAEAYGFIVGYDGLEVEV